MTAVRQAGEALIEASQYGRLKVVRELLKHEDRVDIIVHDSYSNTSLIFASRHGHLEVVQELLQNPIADLNVQGFLGYTALMWAS